ncbi:hypothetical protein OPT61_g7852 [Boeremia exigua]|uniref:Uncharacterized protein n=1 Tax=Boeremia exigua TaxID=749465 RepID=A0ACC2I0K0_9PLEO|nr:hypothetical protein OPT61_g7852 [Boeremia exigua]
MTTEKTGLQPLNYFMTLFPFIASSTIVGFRIRKKYRDRKFAADDLLIIIAQICALGLTVATCIFINVSYTGYRTEDIPPGALNKIEASKWRFVNAVLYNPILALIKVSFILTLIKLDSPSIWIRGSLWTLFTINVMFGFAGTLVALLNCRPIPKFWDRTIPGTCMNTAQYIYGTISVTIITDALVSIVPVFILFNLQMPRRTKALVISFLSLGLVVTAIASYRLSVFVQVFSMDNPLQNESPYNVQTPLSNIEAGLAAIAACGPTLKHLLALMVPMLRSSSTKARSTTPKWDPRSSDKLKTRRSRATKTNSGQGNEIRGSVVELTDTLNWPLGHEGKPQRMLNEENASLRTEISGTNGKDYGVSYERPRSPYATTSILVTDRAWELTPPAFSNLTTTITHRPILAPSMMQCHKEFVLTPIASA